MEGLILKQPLILASSSPRRRELLSQMGLSFEIISPDIDESVKNEENAIHYVQRLAEQKAQAVLKHDTDKLVIAADTTVCVDDEIIGKAENLQQAMEIWHKLSGRYHQVYTGVCVANAEQQFSQVVCTEVEFCVLTEQQLLDYWATGEPIGKAGAYAIQGIASQFIPSIRGSYSNVVGLPLYETMQLLKRFV